MSESTDAIRADIERQRTELGEDVDALADKVTPSKIAHRQTDRMKGALASVKEKIMGAADDVRSSTGSHGSAGEELSQAKDRVQAKAEGNPLAVGLIAFGAGLLVSSLIPASSRERRVAAEAKQKAQPLVDEAKSVAQDVGAGLEEPARDAANAVKDTASDAAAHVREDATEAKDDVSQRAQEARGNVGGTPS
ncbi:DUF3618 domain-containing protein [Microbacterium sp. LRZ72]|uniref:DUF3618 domain-containing protein n=1 Tax=Microbacterium sp. LRZ72 TaxID=2942481 RepID=UPI0029B0A6F8|nr:DUF3618 domain-containing protein [Microbacterium sp. LRZ72]MDX2377895.1 DUF3618 domain-containing protein [Microbacterium sp. LRZ72]